MKKLIFLALVAVGCGSEVADLEQQAGSVAPDCYFPDIGNAEFCADGTLACLARDGRAVTGCILRWQESKDAEGAAMCSTSCENSNR